MSNNCDLLREKGPSAEIVVYTRESPTFFVKSYNWLSVSIVFVQIRIQSGKQYITCTLHYIVEYIQHNIMH